MKIGDTTPYIIIPETTIAVIARPFPVKGTLLIQICIKAAIPRTRPTKDVTSIAFTIGISKFFTTRPFRIRSCTQTNRINRQIDIRTHLKDAIASFDVLGFWLCFAFFWFMAYLFNEPMTVLLFLFLFFVFVLFFFGVPDAFPVQLFKPVF